jgi:murein DD-endopeptidase MepM/ murein hydrolase activator NlpD
LGSLTSNVSAGNKQKKNSLSEFDLSNTFCMDIETNQLGPDGMGKILDEGIPNDIVNSSVSSFIVDFGNKNQNMFQNIQLSTDEFANTEESIFTQVQLTSTDNVAQLSTGKLFTAMENRSYSCTVTSLGNAGIQPLTYFYVKNVPLFYGTYWITNVSHKITPNNMTTTFKGVRQPISKKPTANISIIQQLLKRAEANSELGGYLNTNNRIPIRTSGPVYEYDRTITEYGIFSQEVDTIPGQVVNYDGLWITAAYLHLMTNGDQNNKLLIKALIAYLYNNASLLEGSSSEPTEAIKHFADIVLYDMFVKLGIGTSLYDLLNAHPTTNTAYEEILSDFAKTTTGADKNVFKFLEHDQTLKGIKTTLITTKDGGVIADDPTATVTGVTITYPSNIEMPSDTSKDDFIGSSYWVSDKPANNFIELQGFSRYYLTNKVFNTSGSIFPNNNHNGSIEETFTALQKLPNAGGLSPIWDIYVNPKLYTENGDTIFVDVYTPYTTPDGYPTKIVDGMSSYKLIETISDYKSWLNTNLTQNDRLNIINAYNNNNDVVSLPFDTSKITKGKVGEKYFVVLRYGKAPYVPKIHLDARLRYNRSVGFGNSGNSPILNSSNFFANVDTKPPVVLGFGILTGQTSPLSGEFIYGASYSDPYIPMGEPTGSTQYQADVLGAISDGKSYVSFIAIGLEDQIKAKKVPERSVRGYISKDVLGTKEKPKDWTILYKDIKSDMIYIPPIKKSSNGNKTKVSGWVDPLKSITITSDYGNRILDGKPDFHRGIDLKASIGTPVFSVLPGKVVYAGDSTGYGQVVIIAHQDNSISTLYGHVSEILTSAGTTVKAGDIIAKSGNLGKSTGPHLHFEIRKVVATDKTSYFDIKKDGDEDPESYLSFKGASPDVKTVTKPEIEANILEIKQKLKTAGWDKYEVAAALGNIEQESGFNPYASGKDANIKTTKNIGLIQWNGKTIDDVGRTVDAQMNYLLEGGWKRNTDRFRKAYINKLSTIDTTVAIVKKKGKEGNKVQGLTPEQLKAYVSAYIFADIVEVCAGCNEGAEASTEGFKNYHTSKNAEIYNNWERSEQAVKYLNRMNDTNDKLKW